MAYLNGKEILLSPEMTFATYSDDPEVVALGRTNLAEHGINLDETATTNDIVSNIAKIPSLKYANTVVTLFANNIFPEGTELIIDIPKCADLTRLVYAAKNLKKVKLSGNKDGNLVTLTSAFQNASELEEVDLTGFILRVGVFNTSTFGGCNKLKYVWGEFDCSENSSGMTFPLSSLEEIRFKKETVYKNVTMAACSKLSAESVQSIIDGLAVVETQCTLKLHANVVSVLTEEQMSQILSKNWMVM